MLATTNTSQTKHAVNSFVVSPQKHKARILIVDDEADIRNALVRILRLEGYHAEEVESGQAALDTLQRYTYDLIVLDMHMPGMSGLEVMQYVREHYPEIYIIILTGQATLESAIVATKSDNVIDYLLKPANNEEFVNTIEIALKKRIESQRQQKLASAATQMLNALQQPQITLDPPVIKDVSSTPLQSTPLQTTTERFIHVYPITLDRQKRLMTLVDESPARVIELTRGEAAVLSTLMLNPNQILSCYELVTHALGYEINISEVESVIRPYIFRLRRKLEPNAKKPSLIRTVRRQGYRFDNGE